ncbi:deleted in malignant brain tumors 1 protein-like [Brachionichthys hirsutus]|uniref:deleted in malignant brain tumors 1 protein-like n=1 Tax=Brachionichthys hirsutus TaxID=412623 RepID=UPI0036043E51
MTSNHAFILLYPECEKVRLVGPSRCSGRVELYHNDHWGTVCDDQWGTANADVACRELNCGTAIEAKRGAFFGEGKDDIWLDNVQCTGSEPSILKCQHRPFGDNNCGHGEDAGVICLGKTYLKHLRIMNGSNRCNGRVEIFHDGRWKRVCSSDWGKEQGDVLCQELNCGTPATPTEELNFGSATNLVGVKATCYGNESSIALCRIQEFKENCLDASIVCTNSKPIRLMNGTNRCSGRVEVFYDGQWGTVCDDRWGLQEATVTCREMNCGSALRVKYKAYFGRGSDQVWLDDLQCRGSEKSLSDCPHRAFGEHDCDHSEDAGVVCSECEKVRLVGPSRCSGRVELYHNDRWGTVCDDQWGTANADVACRELNCGTAIEAKRGAFFGEGKDDIWLDDVQCTGSEPSILKCQHRPFGDNNCGHGEDAGVICLDSKPIRLMNGTNQCSGRVEVFYDGQWGTVCDDRWGLQEATVTCREMNCGSALRVKYKAYFGRGSDQVWLDDLQCRGSEKSLSDCPHRAFGEHDCDHSEDAGVVCSGNPPLRLVNGTNRCSGRLEVLHDGLWGTVCDDEWDIRDAQVVCRALDCGSPQAAKAGAFFGQGTEAIWLDDVNCIGNETSLLHCQHSTLGESNCGHAEDAGVVCSATIRLLNGTDQCSGRVQLSHGEHWSSAHNANWGMNEATVVCREMGCGDPAKVSGSFGQSSETRGYKVSCSGRENSLSQCTLRESTRTGQDHVEDATVQCSGNVKLTDGPNRCAGRVEYYDKGRWGPVCGELWDLNDATVVCRQLDCGRPDKITSATEFGQGSGQTWIDQIECGSLESTMAECPQSKFQDRTCNATSIAGVICTGSLEVRLANSMDECSGRVEVRHGEAWQTVCDADWTLRKAQAACDVLQCGTAVQIPGNAHFGQGSGSVVEATQIRLVDGTGQCSGRVEVFYKGLWGTVCDDEWQLPSADVVCRQLGCGHAVSSPMNAHFGRGTGPIWMDNVECTGQETAITHCMHNGFGKNNCGHGEDAGVICLVNFSHKGSYLCEYQKKLPNQVIYYPQGNPADLSVTVRLETPSISLSSPHAMAVYTPDTISVSQAPTRSSSVVSGVVVGLVVLLLLLVVGYLVWRRRSRGAGTVVQFSNSFGGTITKDIDERSNRTFDERGRSTQVKEHSQGLKDKGVEAEADNPVERDPEDLAGRVCYEFEPLVLS